MNQLSPDTGPGRELVAVETQKQEHDLRVEALLETANAASERMASLYIAFLVLCTYVFIVVIGTKDIELLVGRGVRLPLIDVEVPVDGFFSAVPALVVVVHFYLLFQFVLLSRKIFAFLDAIRGDAGREHHLRRLNHLFPFTMYLTGPGGPVVGLILALLIMATMMGLPLGTLLTTQAWFLRYQSETITWWQRSMIWLDVGIIAILWPIIMDSADSWWTYMRKVRRELARRRLFLAWAGPMLGGTVGWFVTGKTGWARAMAAAALAGVVMLLARSAWRTYLRLRQGRAAPASAEDLPQPDCWGLVVGCVIGAVAPVLLTMKGEAIDRPDGVWAREMAWIRHLDVHTQLVVNADPPESRADIWSGDREKRLGALHFLPVVDLRGRSLRGANLRGVFMPNADLRNAVLTDANLDEAELQGARLDRADLARATLCQANLWNARLEGANLADAKLCCADLSAAHLECVNFRRANLSGALLRDARLEGSILSGAVLHDVNLENACLDFVALDGAVISFSSPVKLVSADRKSPPMLDPRKVSWRDMDADVRMQFSPYIPQRRLPAEPWWEQLEKAEGAVIEPESVALAAKVTGAVSMSWADYQEKAAVALDRLGARSPYLAAGALEWAAEFDRDSRVWPQLRSKLERRRDRKE